MRISQRSIEEVKEAADIVEVASEFTALKRQGARMVGLCPYPDHPEKTPSFSVSPDQGFYYCFGCAKGGDAIKLVTDLKGLSFSEAVSYLAERSGVELQFEGRPEDSKAAQERSQRRRTIHKALAAATVYYHKYLLNAESGEAEEARRYLRSRGITDSTIGEFRLGYAPRRGRSGLFEVMRKLRIGREVLDAAGLLSPRGGERFAGRVTFPISDRRGRIVGFGARAMGDAQPKYLNSPETEIFAKRELLYGFPQVAEAIRRERSALVVEGYTDVLMLYQSGIKNAVATLGTATTPAHLRTLSGYADRIYVLFDPDAAGEKAIERAAETAAGLKLDLRVLRLPQDPADWLFEHSAEEFRALISDAVPALEYNVRRIVERARGAGAIERSRAVPEIQELMQRVTDPVLHHELVRLATEALGVRPEIFQEPRRPVAGISRTDVRPGRGDPLRSAGRQLLALILARPDLAVPLLKEGVRHPALPGPLFLSTTDFADEKDALLFSVFDERVGEDLTLVLTDERLRPVMDRIGELHAESEKLYPSEASLREAWLRQAILSRERAKRAAPDYDLKERLQSEIRSLRDALRTVAAEP